MPTLKYLPKTIVRRGNNVMHEFIDACGSFPLTERLGSLGMVFLASNCVSSSRLPSKVYNVPTNQNWGANTNQI